MLLPILAAAFALGQPPTPLPDGPHGPVQPMPYIAWIDYSLPKVPGKAWMCVEPADHSITCVTFSWVTFGW